MPGAVATLQLRRSGPTAPITAGARLQDFGTGRVIANLPNTTRSISRLTRAQIDLLLEAPGLLEDGSISALRQALLSHIGG